MAEYKSEEVRLHASAETVYEKLSNLEGLKELLGKLDENQIPADKREMFEQINITADTITIPGGGPVGQITLRLTDKVAPRLIKLVGEGTPVPVSLVLNIQPETADTCEAQVVFDLAIPAMLKPMVAGPLSKMTAQFAQVLQSIPFGK